MEEADERLPGWMIVGIGLYLATICLSAFVFLEGYDGSIFRRLSYAVLFLAFAFPGGSFIWTIFNCRTTARMAKAKERRDGGI